ncbi:MAG TPA: AraC family transcriptional regulator [Gemmatimonadales bacterium]|nr:AraC family transcriptional regulator [Gemmatimonadales bacterium]
MSRRGRAGYPQAVQGTGTIITDVRRVLRAELLRDTCSAAEIARLFSMHRRTMSRYLRIRGLTFRQVANEVRFEIACELLENTDMALGQIAATLKYSEPSAFTRAFRRWCGQSPSDWRASHPRARKSRRTSKPHRPHPESGPESATQDEPQDSMTITE